MGAIPWNRMLIFRESDFFTVALGILVVENNATLWFDVLSFGMTFQALLQDGTAQDVLKRQYNVTKDITSLHNLLVIPGDIYYVQFYGGLLLLVQLGDRFLESACKQWLVAKVLDTLQNFCIFLINFLPSWFNVDLSLCHIVILWLANMAEGEEGGCST